MINKGQNVSYNTSNHKSRESSGQKKTHHSKTKPRSNTPKFKDYGKNSEKTEEFVTGNLSKEKSNISFGFGEAITRKQPK